MIDKLPFKNINYHFVNKEELETRLRNKFWEVYESSLELDRKIDEWNRFDSEMFATYKEYSDSVVVFLHLNSLEDFRISSCDKSKRWRFSFRVSFVSAPEKKNRQYSAIEFCDVDFLSEFSFGMSLLGCGLYLERVVFEENASFLIEKFDSESEGLGGDDICPDFIEIRDSIFKKGTVLSIHESSGVETIKFTKCNFSDSLKLSIHNNFTSFKLLSFCDSKFYDDVVIEHSMIEMDEDLISGGSIIRELKFDRCFLKNILNLSLNNIGSLSIVESYIDYKKFFCSGYSLTEPTKVFKDDEPKFRFLKKYFAEQGNHFKEQQYFAYEMIAREESLRSNIFSFDKVKEDFYGWLKSLSDFFIFFAYKWTSNFGMSWVRPVVYLVFSFYWFGSLFEKVGLESPLIKSFVRTFNIISPLSSDVERFPLLAVFLTVQSLLNAGLIFLFGLGLRNKFKVK